MITFNHLTYDTLAMIAIGYAIVIGIVIWRAYTPRGRRLL